MTYQRNIVQDDTWTQHQVNVLTHLYRKIETRELAFRLGKTVGAVHAKLRRLGPPCPHCGQRMARK